MKEFYLHKSLSSCCEAFFESWGTACVYEDICTPLVETTEPTKGSVHQSTTVVPSTPKPFDPSKPNPIMCNSAPWHPSEDLTTCTNSVEYPQNWNSPSLSSSYLLKTAESCCQMFFFSWGKSCVINDICTETAEDPYAQSSKPTTSPTQPHLPALCDEASKFWHPTLDKSKCSNRYV